MIDSITIIVPCYNEEPGVLRQTLDDLGVSVSGEDVAYEIIVVDDGSSTPVELPEETGHLRLIRHKKNKGYGSALKTGIRHATFTWIGITDADGTYPNLQFNELFRFAESNDMVIGARAWENIPRIRRLPKKILTWFSSFLADTHIPDLNSGMRIFRKRLALDFWHLYPTGFSFTSTLTIGAITNDADVHFHPVDYYERVGISSIHPMRDTIRFFSLVTRLSLYFKPKKFFVPLSLICLFIALARGWRDFATTGSFGGLTLILFFAAFQIFFFGLLAEIINKTRQYLISNDDH